MIGLTTTHGGALDALITTSSLSALRLLSVWATAIITAKGAITMMRVGSTRDVIEKKMSIV